MSYKNIGAQQKLIQYCKATIPQFLKYRINIRELLNYYTKGLYKSDFCLKPVAATRLYSHVKWNRFKY